MRYKLRMSRYGGILGRGHLPWALSLVLEGRGGRQMCGAGRFEDRCLVVGSSVTLMLDTSCSTGTFVYCTQGSLHNRHTQQYLVS